MTTPPDDSMDIFWEQEFYRSQVYDSGHRDEIMSLLCNLRDQARQQFDRSKCTLSNKFARDGDQWNHDWDAQVYYTLQTLLDARYVPIKVKYPSE
jgi:hypothetical protein